MKIINKKDKNTSVVLISLNGCVDNAGNIKTSCKTHDWTLVSNQGGVDHFMRINRYNHLRAKHKFVNRTNEDVVYNWTIDLVTNSGQNFRYDFGQVTVRPDATQFSISVPYNYSRMLSCSKTSRIMVAFMNL